MIAQEKSTEDALAFTEIDSGQRGIQIQELWTGALGSTGPR